jgi:hypothetical protein
LDLANARAALDGVYVDRIDRTEKSGDKSRLAGFYGMVAKLI